uniref:Uncharacterized protein n=1 Tax=Tanacetum cinerariifolium TaxID=118510 RepID=A0A6L2LY68_TANCI|nr:hypothetical protein [Tanacetum cinerariifolium]
MAGSDDENPPQQAPHTVSTIKLHNLKKGEYDIWAMKIEHYLTYTDYPIWEVIQRGNGPVSVSIDTNGVIKVLPPKAAEEILARERERKARTTLLIALPEDHLVKFHKMTDAKEMWEAIKSKFGVSTKDANQKFLKSLSASWSQVAMIFMRLKKFYKKTGRKLQFDAKEPVGFDKTKEKPKALVTLDGDGVDWTSHSKDEKENFNLMAYSNSGLDTEREQLGDASIEIQAYYQALKKVEAQLVAHQKNQLWYEEKIRFMKIDLDDKTDVLTYHKKLLAEAKKEKEELKAKIEKWQNSSKGLHNLLDSQMSAKDKSGLGRNACSSPSNDKDLHAPRFDFVIDESMFTYGPKQSKTSESDAETSNSTSCESNSSVETFESVPKQVANKPKAVSEHKVWSDAPIIKEYESDSDDEHVTIPSKEQEKLSFAFVNTVKHVKTPRQTVKEQNTYSQNDPQNALKNKGIVDSGCSMHMTRNKAYLVKYQDYNGGPVAFGGSKGHITVLLRVPRQNNMHSFNLENIVPTGGLTCLIAKAIVDKSNKWHRRLGHVNFKNLNKLVKGNLVRGLPSKIFQNGHTCVACEKGKQHKASCIKREYNNARTPQQNEVSKRKNMTLIEATKTMLTDSFLPNTFWAEAVSTTCLFLIGCHVAILNAIDHLGKFDGKSDEGFLVGYSLNSKAFRVYNFKTKRVEENMHINFLENKPNVVGKGPNWLFDLDYLTDSMNYQLVRIENQANKTAGPKETNNSAGTQDNSDTSYSKKEAEPAQEYFVLPSWSSYTSTDKSSKAKNGGKKPKKDTSSKFNEKPVGAARAGSTNTVNTVSTPVSTTNPSRVFSVVPDFTNLETTINVSHIPTSKVYKNKKDERGVVVRNKARLVTQGYRQEKGIDYDEVFTPVDKIEAIHIFLAFASYMGFIVYQMDVKSAFLYGIIDEEVYVSQPLGFIDTKYPNKVYKVMKALYGLHQAPRACTLIETQKPLNKDEEAVDVTPKTLHLHAEKRIFSDYARANLDRKSTTGGCQFLGRRLISWQCKKQIIMATSTTEAEYVAAVGKHHFIRDAYEKKLIQVLKIHTDDNVADLLTKAFDVSSSQTVNDEKQIQATVDSKAVVVTEASIRSSLLFNDADGTAYLTNEAIFQNLSLMGYEGELNKLTFQKALFSPQWKYLIHTILHCLSSKSTSWNKFSTNIASAVICLAINQKFNFSKLIFDGMLRNLDTLKKKFLMYLRFLMMFLNNQIELGETFNDVYTTPDYNLKVFTNMSRKGVKFSGKITPLFPNMLTHTVVEEGKGSGASTEPQPTPSPTYPSTGDQPHVTESLSCHDTTQDSRDSLKGTNGSEWDQVQIPHNSPPSGSHTSDRAEGALNLLELIVLCTNLSNRVLALETVKEAQAAEIIALKTRIKKLESISKQGRKKAKPESTVDDSTIFDDLDVDYSMDYMDKKEDVDKGRQISTATPNVDAARQEVSAVEPRTPPTTSIFDDEDITMAQTLIKMKEKAKEKGMTIKDIEDSSRPARSILTLKPPLTIDPKSKGKRVLKESTVKKVKRSDLDAAQIAKDAEVARLVYEEELAELEREKEERQRQEEASKADIAEMYYEVQAGIDADALKFKATQRFAEIRSRPPTKSQLRNLMMTYLKNMGGYKHYQLNAKTFTEIQGLYERQKRVIDDFKPMDSDDAVKDIKEAAGVHKEKVLEEPDSTKVEVKQEGHEENIRKRPCRRLKMKATKKSKRQKTDADLEGEEKLRDFLKIILDEEEIIDYEVLDKRFPIINWESKFYHLDRHGAKCIYYRIFRSDGSSRWIKTFSEMVTRFDMLDLKKLYNLVIQRFETTTLEEDGTEIYMLAERRYPLTQETLERMLALRLIAESESEAAFDLLRFIQKQIDESRGHDGNDKDWKLTQEKFKELQYVWIHPPGVQEAQVEENIKVIENVNSWVSVPQTTQENGPSVSKISVLVTAEEKINKKNDVKARSLLLMALLNEHLLTFSQYSNAKTMYAAIKTRFRGDIKTMSIDDLYNNFKIVKQEVKKSVGASTSTQNIAFMTAPSTSSTNNVNTANSNVSTVNSNVNTASTKDSTASLNDATVYAFLANQPNGCQLVHEDLEQIYDDDLKEMDLKWQLTLLSIMARKFYQRTGKKITINGSDTSRYDKSKDNTRKTVNVEETSSKAMLAIDGVGFGWSDMTEEQVQTNIALMAFSDSEVYNDKACSKTCLKNYETLKKQCDDLIVKLNETKLKAATYKRGLATVEDQLVSFRKNEVLFSEEIAVLKREVGCKDYEMGVLKTEYEKVKQEKEGIDFKIAKFDKSSKSIGLDEFKEPKFNRYGPKDTVLKTTIECDKESDNSKENTDDSLEKEQVTDNESSFVESPLKFDKETVIDWK